MLKDQGKIEEAATHYRRAVELKPDSAMMHGNLLLCEQYRARAPRRPDSRLPTRSGTGDTRRRCARLAPSATTARRNTRCAWGSSLATSASIRSGCSPYEPLKGSSSRPARSCATPTLRRIDYQSVSPAGRTDRQPGSLNGFQIDPSSDRLRICPTTRVGCHNRAAFIAAADRWVETAELLGRAACRANPRRPDRHSLRPRRTPGRQSALGLRA